MSALSAVINYACLPIAFGLFLFSCESRVEALNALIPTWASGKSTSASPIYVANVWSAFPASSTSTYTRDGVHPNTDGSQRMADVWYSRLIAQEIP